MTLVSGIVVFQVIWWVIFFAVLPFGVKVPLTSDKGFATSAPENPQLIKKVIITTFITLILWGISYYIIENNIISII